MCLGPFYAGAGVRQAARMRVGAHRPFSGQTIDALPVDIDAGGYTSPTVRGLSGETPERPHSLRRSAQENTSTPVECAQAGSLLPSGVSCDREHEHTVGRQSQQNPFIGDEAPEVIERYADIRGI